MLVLVALVLAATAGAVVFAWTHYEPFHRARRDADRVFRALTGTNPVHHDSYGNYLGFDARPTAEAFGPLKTPIAVRDEMYRFSTALAHAGFHPDQFAYDPRLWCTIPTDDNAWAPSEAPPTVVRVHCTVGGSNAHNTAHASLILTFQVPPAQLHPTRTVTGWYEVSADNALDLLVSSGTLEADASRKL